MFLYVGIKDLKFFHKIPLYALNSMFMQMIAKYMVQWYSIWYIIYYYNQYNLNKGKRGI